MRAFVDLWDEITRERYGITDAKQRLFRYGVQVNSLGLTEQQPENNVSRILIEMLAVTLSKKARARAVQLPAWNEALGLPRPWDQQWSLRMQQILAYETDLLEYGDLFDGSKVMEAKVAALKDEARDELKRIEAMGGAVAARNRLHEEKTQQLVRSTALGWRRSKRRSDRGRSGRQYIESEPSPLTGGVEAIMTVSAEAEVDQLERLHAWRAQRDATRSRGRPQGPQARREEGRNIMPASIVCAKAGVTTGEWGWALRGRFPASTALRPASATQCATTLAGSTTSAPTSTACRASSAGD